MKEISWGIIGCGDVTEVKSGPAFNKVENSVLTAVMRRNASKAKDYAKRHKVPKWYSNADELINDDEVNAIYIATPPSSHLEYALKCIEADKPFYVEKPMALNTAQAVTMAEKALAANVKAVVAHYRRALPMYIKIKQQINMDVIGDVRMMNIHYHQPVLRPAELRLEKNAWRVNPSIAGGGLFHDIAPHQIDVAYFLFGQIAQVRGVSANQARIYNADDMVAGNILFKNSVVLNGTWNFCSSPKVATDLCEIVGTKGKITFSFFGSSRVEVLSHSGKKNILFETYKHIQQPMIEQMVKYFLGEGSNPCSLHEGIEVMKAIDAMCE